MTEISDNPDRSTLADRIYEQLRDAIVLGELAEGEELSQVALARQFGVSRIPVREALNRLEAQRLVTSEPFQRHTIRTLSAEEIRELMEIRIQLECLGVRRAGERLDRAELESLLALNGRLAEETDPKRWLEGDWELHRRLMGPGTACAEFVDAIRLRIHRYLNARLRGRHAAAVREHDAILQALLDGDVEQALARLRDHILATARALVEVAEEASPD